MAGLQQEVWIQDIKENPIPDNSFVFASTDKSPYVKNNVINLIEAGVEPATHENFFEQNPDAELPIADVSDIPHDVTLKIYSTEATRHRNLEEVELVDGTRQSIVARHKTSLAKNIGKRAAHAWTASTSDAFNKLMNLGANDSVIDAITDLRAFYMAKDINDGLNLCLTPEHWARIKKEDKKLYKELMADKNKVYADFRIFTYSKCPLFTSAGAKKPYGAAAEAGDRKASFTWVTEETFRCFGDTEMYFEPKKARIQADLLSFGQRALVGAVRANSPKYFGAII
ncbi:hypothetical protein PL373_07960 [Tenacibaculum maritimum]|nr:hypothetical protein [Tenacibaculum maritimum]MDB0601080.1 hypothetical protein [Tenacibaculum maritimum]MDB0612161.1 hypothetical protein [Tenacibaculum maritimum]